MPSSIDSTNMEDEAERMELVLNSDLCSVLLDCWEDSKPDKDQGGSSTGSRTPSGSDRNRLWEGGSDGNPVGDLPNFLMEDFGAQKAFAQTQPAPFPPAAKSVSTETQAKSTVSNTSAEARTTVSAMSQSFASSDVSSQQEPQHPPVQQAQTANQSGLSSETSSAATKLHPQGITSAADCPPHVAALNAASSILPLPFAVPTSNRTNTTSTSSLVPPHQMLLPQPTAVGARVSNSLEQPKRGTSESKGSTTQQQQQSNPPPFLLFDAPMELRANFIQSQRAHGLPVLEDNNSYHYGMAVNGFHPTNLRLLDARHGDPGSKRAKNAKEQKRAQQITKLIEQLRVKMERDGWKVELKSKFHTLSSCANYVKHLVKTNKDKEEAIEKAKLDLKAKQRQIQEDKAQQDPSDPESTTSDLTESSGSAGATGKVRKAESSDPGDASGDCSGNSQGEPQKHLMVSQESTVSSTSGEDQQGFRTVVADQTASVSDVTDSNKGSSMNSSSSGKGNLGSLGPLSSDAAVASGSSHENTHSGVVIQGEKRKSRPGKAALKGVTDFDVDYEEVFVKSNVPQLLATPSGRVVAWNGFFLRVAGLKAKDVRPLTIFSLVKSQNLAKLFEIVAAALRTGSLKTEGDDDKDKKNDDSSRNWDYAAITLPCVKFPRDVADGTENRQVFMTVTLMADEDPRKRCFHCVFTDNPGTNGSLGSITPELLASLFTKPGEDSKPAASSRKKRRTQK